MGVTTFLGEIIGNFLLYLTELTGNYGIAIILLTITIRLLMYPLTLNQMKSAVKMRKLQPKLQALQERFKDNPQEYQKRIMELWKEHGINPLSGCLPLLIQLPILYALFAVLRDFNFEGISPNFLFWDLSVNDPYYVLPILAGVTTYLQAMMTMTDPSQRTMLMVMPVVITLVSVSFPAGLVLYWLISNLFAIGQQYLITRMVAEGGQGTA